MKNGKKDARPTTRDLTKKPKQWKRMYALLKFDGRAVLKIDWDRATMMPSAGEVEYEEKKPRGKAALERGRLYMQFAQLFAGAAAILERTASEMMPKSAQTVSQAEIDAAAAMHAAAHGRKRRGKSKKTRTAASAPPAP